MSKPEVKVQVRFSSTTASARLRTVTAVRPLLRPRLARAMAGRNPLPPAARRTRRGRRRGAASV